MIPYGHQDITETDIQSVVDVLQSDFLTQGPVVTRFEKEVALKVGAKHGVAVNSATSALHIACLALNLGPGDVLWTSPNTFVASANCALYCGATVDFVDIDPYTYNMSIESLAAKLEQAEKLGCLPSIVVPVHFAGQPCDMLEIHALSKVYGFKIIEDASHAIGGMYGSEYIGNCRYSDITVFSFHPVKIITTGEGGMGLTNDDGLAAEMDMLRSHGITRDTSLMQHGSAGPWYYEQQMLGYNYRMTDIQAALGISQLTRLDEYIERRNVLAELYTSKLNNLPLQLPVVNQENKSAYHLYVVHLDLSESNKKYKQIFNELREKGIGINLHYLPVHLQPYYRKFGFVDGQFPNAESHSKKAISLPLYPTLMDVEVDLVVDSIYQTLMS